LLLLLLLLLLLPTWGKTVASFASLSSSPFFRRLCLLGSIR
jgi:hypothetical protein